MLRPYFVIDVNIIVSFLLLLKGGVLEMSEAIEEGGG